MERYLLSSYHSYLCNDPASAVRRVIDQVYDISESYSSEKYLAYHWTIALSTSPQLLIIQKQGNQLDFLQGWNLAKYQHPNYSE